MSCAVVWRWVHVDVRGEAGLEGPLQRAIAVDHWSIDSDGGLGTGRYLSGHLIQGDGLEGLIIIIVDGLQEGLVVGEDRNRIAAEICLAPWSAVRLGARSSQRLTIMRRESQKPVARA